MSGEDRDRAESPRVIHLKHHTYQASKAELEEPIVLPGDPTPEELARVLLRPAKVVHDDPGN